jgi:hypothetical protein
LDPGRKRRSFARCGARFIFAKGVVEEVVLEVTYSFFEE